MATTVPCARCDKTFDRQNDEIVTADCGHLYHEACLLGDDNQLKIRTCCICRHRMWQNKVTKIYPRVSESDEVTAGAGSEIEKIKIKSMLQEIPNVKEMIKKEKELIKGLKADKRNLERRIGEVEERIQSCRKRDVRGHQKISYYFPKKVDEDAEMESESDEDSSDDSDSDSEYEDDSNNSDSDSDYRIDEDDSESETESDSDFD